jgi:hypothetical protein
MAITRSCFSKLAEAILEAGAKKATKYCSPSEVVKATFRGRRDRRNRRSEILFTIGTPNFAERQFIKQAKKAGEPFPIRKIQMKFAKTGRR